MDEFVGYLKDKNANFTLMHCTTQYPTPLEKVGLNNLSLMQKRYSIPIGLSDHSGTIYPAIAAYFLGASSVELHVTLSKYMFGPDVSSSVDIDQLATLKNMIKTFDVLLENPVNKDIMSNQLTDLKKLYVSFNPLQPWVVISVLEQINKFCRYLTFFASFGKGRIKLVSKIKLHS